MLYLKSGVHLHKIKGTVRIEQKFDCSGSDIVYGLGGSYGSRPHAGTQFFSQSRGGRFFDNFLMAALYRTIALKKVHAVAMTVCKHLDFYVSRFF